MGNWFGKGCEHQCCKFESWYNEIGDYEEDRSSPELVFCNHKDNPDDCEGNCNERQCPLGKKETVTRIVQVTFAGNNEVKYDFFTDIPDIQVGDPVVCDTARGYSIGKVVGFVEASTKARSWIVQRVDVEGHRARMEERRLADELAEMLG